VSWKDTVNGALRRTGYELRRANAAPPGVAKPHSRKVRPGDRLLEQPGFVMCTLRSGSTLLRVLLNSHSQIHCPHEIHLRYLSVGLDAKWVERSMKEMGLDQEKLEYLLWDRVLQRELTGSGKPRLVTKTPNDVFIADRIKTAWPDAKLIFSPTVWTATAWIRSATACPNAAPPYCSTRTRSKNRRARASSFSSSSTNSIQPAGTMFW